MAKGGRSRKSSSARISKWPINALEANWSPYTEPLYTAEIATDPHQARWFPFSSSSCFMAITPFISRPTDAGGPAPGRDALKQPEWHRRVRLRAFRERPRGLPR